MRSSTSERAGRRESEGEKEEERFMVNKSMHGMKIMEGPESGASSVSLFHHISFL